MKKVEFYLVSLVLLFISMPTVKIEAQTLNLVPNQSFEDFTGCPADIECGAIYQGQYWQNVDITPCPANPPYTYLRSSPDYFNPCGQGVPPVQSQQAPGNCFGYQTGFNNSNSYAGLYTYYNSVNDVNYREYIRVSLFDELKPNKQYILKMHVSLAEESNYATKGIGMNLSTNPIEINNNGSGYPRNWQCLNNLNPQLISTSVISDKSNWTPLTTTITALGGEKHITIGCFKNDNDVNATWIDGLHQEISYYYIDQVSITPINFASPDVSVCPGSCTTLNADIGNFNITYQWSSSPSGFSSTSSTPTVCPTVATTYTVTATDANGGTATDAVVVSMLTPPDKPIISGYFNTCHGLTTYTITNPEQNFTYYYNINYGGTHVPFTTNQFNINWASYPNGGVLYVTVTDTNGCTATDSLKVFGCCDVNHGGLLPRYQDTTFTAAPSAGSFVINGILTIDGSFSLNTKFIYFGPNAKIIINPSRTLTISNSSLSVGCDTMWDGIYLNYANSSLVVDNSNIRDAKNAVVSNACAVYTITNSTFNNNYRNIVVQSCSGTNNSNISGSTLTCTATLKPQYPTIAATRTYSGVEINNVGGITVGNTALAANRNYFNNMDFGIKNYCSNLEVYNNTFQNMSYGSLSYPPSSGVGIISTAGKFTPKNLTVGGISNGTFNTNKFESCFWGVYADYYQNVTIQRDTFNSTGSWTSIYLYSHPSKTIKVLSNVITDGMIGIHNGHCFNSTIDINYNRITNNFFGIAALNVNPATVQKLNIYNNYIWNNTYGNGIQVTNIQGVAGSNTQRANISNNFVYINNPDLNNVQGSNGILVNQSPYTLIQLNTVSRSSGTVADSTQAKRLNGIHVQLSPNSKLCQNTVSRMGCGLRFNGTMANTTLQLNNMLNYYFYGIRFDNAFIGNQGDTANCIAWRNRWNISSSLIRIQGTPSSLHKWLYDGPNNTNNLYYPAPNSVSPPQNLQLQSCPNYITSCSEIIPLSALSPYTPVVENTYNYTIYPEENRYWDKQFFYDDIQNSPALTSSLSTNAHALSFYNMLDANNIGGFAKVNTYMNNEDYAAAEATNNGITPGNDMEKNRQIVNGIYINTWAKGRFEFTANERSVLEAIAYLEPLTGGSAVYSACVMLGINPPVITGSNKKAVQQSDSQNHVSAIYPNPANDVAYLDYTLANGHKANIYFYNLMGTLIEAFTINSSENRFEFSTKNFKSGLYFYVVMLDNNKILESNKLIIIK